MTDNTFAYDMISFLRVIYRRRWFIIRGTVITAILTAVVSLILPETWRATAGVGVHTPKLKSSLQLFPEHPFDVKFYEAVMRSDNLYAEIIQTYRWLNRSVHQLLDEPSAYNRLRENLQEKAETLTNYQLVENTNLQVLSELLIPPGMENNTQLKQRISILGLLNNSQIEEIYNTDEGELDDFSVFDLRKNLSTGVDVLVDTNLEKVYSNYINVSAKAGTAVGARLLCNIWIDLFVQRAEEIVRSNIQKQMQAVKNNAAAISISLVSAETQLKDFDNKALLSSLRAELASKQILLTGMNEHRQTSQSTNENFDLETEGEPFMKERRNFSESIQFDIAPNYDNALIPKKVELEKKLLYLQSLENNDDIQAKINEAKSELSAVHTQIQTVSSEINTLLNSMQQLETDRKTHLRSIERAQSEWSTVQPLLAEVSLLENQGSNIRYADVSYEYAIRPDKRDFPRRSIMTIIGCGAGLALFTALAFLKDIWTEITVADETSS